MGKNLSLLAQLIWAQPLEHWLALLPAHLWITLGVLGCGSTVGLYHVFGVLFQGSFVAQRRRVWLALPLFVLCLLSIGGLLSAYTLWFQAPAWARLQVGGPAFPAGATAQRTASRIGARILHPLLGDRSHPSLAAEAMRSALNAHPQYEYEQALRELYRAPLRRASPARTAEARQAYRDELLAQIALGWLVTQHPQSAETTDPAPPGAPRTALKSGSTTLTRFLADTLTDLPSDLALSAQVWRYIAGIRFTHSVLLPVLEELLRLLSVLHMLATLLLWVGGGFGLVRLRARNARKALRAASAQLPVATLDPHSVALPTHGKDDEAEAAGIPPHAEPPLAEAASASAAPPEQPGKEKIKGWFRTLVRR